MYSTIETSREESGVKLPFIVIKETTGGSTAKIYERWKDLCTFQKHFPPGDVPTSSLLIYSTCISSGRIAKFFFHLSF